jgi:hypothetical protein
MGGGEIVAQCRKLDDELIVASCDLDAGRYIKQNIGSRSGDRLRPLGAAMRRRA